MHLPFGTVKPEVKAYPLLLACLACILLLGGMVYSPYLQSVSMFLLGIAAVWHTATVREKHGYWVILPFAVVSLHFFLVLSSVLYPLSDVGYLLERLRIKVPFLGLPLVFFLLPSFPQRYYHLIWNFLLVLLGITSLGIAVNYFLHQEQINLMIRQGQPMPMPCNHIRYSLLQTMGIAGGLYLLQERYTHKETLTEKGFLQLPTKWIWVLTLWLFIAQHLIAVRSGLMVAYVLIGAAVLREIIIRKKYFLGVLALSALALAPVLAYRFIPSVRTKVGYMRYDYDLYRKGQDIGVLSDASRWVSLGIGWKIYQASPWTGTGPGNLRYAVGEQYATYYPEISKRLMPHNQFLHTAAGSGTIGLILFSISFFIPLFYRRYWAHFPFLALHIAAFLSFLVEATLESAMGVAFYLFFLLLGLNFMKGRPI